MRVLSQNPIIGALCSVQGAKLTIVLDFKTIAKYNFIVAVIYGLICLLLVYLGWGVWSLIWQSKIANVIKVVLLWGNSKRKPQLILSKKSFKELFGFGNKLMFSGLLHTLFITKLGKLSHATALLHVVPISVVSALVFNLVKEFENTATTTIKVVVS